MILDGIKVKAKWLEYPVSDFISESDVYEKDRLKIITLDWIKKIADWLWIVVKETPWFLCQPDVWNRQQHIWWLRMWFKWDSDRDNWIYSEWEASQLNTWKITYKDWKREHDEINSVDSKFKSNMAYKRAYCRWVIRLASLYGLYSNVEAVEFQKVEWSTMLEYEQL